MATNDDTRVSELRARVAKFGHELLESDGVRDEAVRYFILDPGVRKLTAVIGGTLADVESWVHEYENPDGTLDQPEGQAAFDVELAGWQALAVAEMMHELLSSHGNLKHLKPEHFDRLLGGTGAIVSMLDGALKAAGEQS